MKSIRSFSLIRFGCIAFGLSAVALTARGQVLLEDQFSGAGIVNGRTPDTADTGGVKWVDTSLGDQFSGPSSNTVSGGVDNYSLNDAYPIILAYAGSNFVDGQTYNLLTNFTYTSGTGWIGIGFFNGSESTGFGNNGTAFNNGMAWMINNGQGNDVNGFANTNGSGPFAGVTGDGTAGLNSGVMEIQLTIGTGLNAGDGTATFLMGPDASHLTAFGTPLVLGPTEVQAISGVGFYAYGYASGPTPPTGTIDNFTLEVAPEPGSGVLLLFGLGALVVAHRIVSLRRI